MSGTIALTEEAEAPLRYHPAHELALKCGLAGVSNATSACVTNPADLVKVRQQLYIKQGSGLSPGFLSVMAGMVRNEGFFSLYNGVSASVLRELFYSGLRMGAYDLFKSGIQTVAPGLDSHSVAVKLGAGLGSGCLGAAVANPADVLKVRMQAIGGSKFSLRQHAADIWRQDGVRGFYRGLVPTVLRAGLLTSSQLGSYDVTKHFVRTHYSNYFPEGMFTHFICSGVAGFTCSVTSAPVDTIKVRIMNDKTGQFKSSLDCAIKLLRNEGPLAFYKGFFGCWIRLWPHTVISLMIFERLRSLAGLNPI